MIQRAVVSVFVCFGFALFFGAVVLYGAWLRLCKECRDMAFMASLLAAVAAAICLLVMSMNTSGDSGFSLASCGLVAFGYLAVEGFMNRQYIRGISGAHAEN